MTKSVSFPRPQLRQLPKNIACPLGLLSIRTLPAQGVRPAQAAEDHPALRHPRTRRRPGSEPSTPGTSNRDGPSSADYIAHCLLVMLTAMLYIPAISFAEINAIFAGHVYGIRLVYCRALHGAPLAVHGCTSQTTRIRLRASFQFPSNPISPSITRTFRERAIVDAPEASLRTPGCGWCCCCCGYSCASRADSDADSRRHALETHGR